MNKIAYILMSLFLWLNTVAQTNKAQITAPKVEHDFGAIKEVDGKVTCTFIIKNTGSAPLAITRVVAACGCTTPVYETEPIAPGAESKIVVTFNPAGRPGQFVKTIAVYSNGYDGALILRVKGNVE